MMRATIHLVSKRDYWPFVVGIRKGLREWWLRDAHRALAGGRSLPTTGRYAGAPRQDVEPFRAGGGDRKALGGRRGVFVDLVRAPPSGTWSVAVPTSTRSPRTGSGRKDATENEGIEH